MSTRILNVNSNILLSAKNESNPRIDISTLNPGIYILKIKSGNKLSSYKIIVTK